MKQDIIQVFDVMVFLDRDEIENFIIKAQENDLPCIVLGNMDDGLDLNLDLVYRFNYNENEQIIAKNILEKSLLRNSVNQDYIKYKMNIDDSEIYLAVRYHTTGRAGMSLIEKIIYVADFISAERDYEDVDVMRALAAQSLEKAMLYALKYTITSLVKKGSTVHADSVAAYNELILNMKGKC